MSNLVANGEGVQNFPLPGFLVQLEESSRAGLEQVKDLFGDGHLAIAAGSFAVGDCVGINHTLEEQRALVGHALFIFTATNILRKRFINHNKLNAGRAAQSIGRNHGQITVVGRGRG